jgi:16S rRNA C1402 (ribose-2'-O) methylase RsmI
MLEARPSLKGEHTLLVGGFEDTGDVDRDLVFNELKQLNIDTDRPLSDLVKEVAARHGLSRKVVYEEALKLKKKGRRTRPSM